MASYSVLLFSSLIFLPLALTLGSRSRRSPLKLPPGPMHLPILGDLLLIDRALSHRSLWFLFQKHGPLMQLQLRQKRTVVVSSATMAAEVFKNNDQAVSRRAAIVSNRTLTYNFSNVAFSPDNGSYWKEMRRQMIRDLGNAKKARSFMSIRDAEVERMVSAISTSTAPPQPVDLKKVLINLIHGYRICSGHPVWCHRHKRSSSGMGNGGADEEPRREEEMPEEVRRNVGKKGSPDEEDLAQLHYLKSVVKETMRLHPPAPPLIPRECTQHCKIDGYDVLPGTTVIINAWAIGRDPSAWDCPDELSPGRFMNSSIDYKGHDFAIWIGEKGRPGFHFAAPTIELAMGNLVYYWELPPGVSKETLDMTEASGFIRFPESSLLAPNIYDYASLS